MDKPMVGIVMGSKSDLVTMEDAAKLLAEFGVGYEMRVISAHRTPDIAVEFAKTARDRGIKVIIAGAGMAAHLAGAMAANSLVPVIGVPLSSGALSGVDALYSTVMMPPGIPVATVAVGGAYNAALLAVQILATSDHELHGKLVSHRKAMEAKVLAADAEIN